jgi:hypothetical protein
MTLTKVLGIVRVVGKLRSSTSAKTKTGKVHRSASLPTDSKALRRQHAEYLKAERRADEEERHRMVGWWDGGVCSLLFGLAS